MANQSGASNATQPRRTWPAEMNVFIALIIIIVAFELLGRAITGQSFLLNSNPDSDAIFNVARLKIIILQVAIVGIIALGTTQVIVLGGIDLSPGAVVGATAMIAMSFGQAAQVNGGDNPGAVFGAQGWLDLPVIVPVLVGLGCGLIAGLINGLLIARTDIPPFIATLGMMVGARGVAQWWTRGQPVSFPTEGYSAIGAGMTPVAIFVVLALLFAFIMSHTRYGKHTYAIGSNEMAARMVGINVERHKILVYTIAGVLAGLAGLVASSKALTAQSGMGMMFELDAIAMAVIGGVSLSGGRGTILGTVLGALIFGVIISGFTFLRLDSYYQEMLKAVIIVGAVVLDRARQRRSSNR